MKKQNRNNHSKLDSLLVDAIDQSPLPVLITDVKGKIVYINPSFSRSTGYSLSEIKGKNPRILKSGLTPAKVYKDLWNTILAGHTWKGELCNKNKMGQTYWESIFISPIMKKGERISHFIGVWQDITDRKFDEGIWKSQLKDLENEAKTDTLTGLYNRRHILVELDREVERAVRYKRRLAALLIDIDQFKAVNEVYGYLAGDQILCEFSSVLEGSLRKVDILGRYGGDEFLVIFPETPIETARVVMDRILKNIKAHLFALKGHPVPMRLSVGLASLKGLKTMDYILFIEKIDQALLKAKKAGGNQAVVHP